MWRKGESPPKYLELKGDVEQAGKGAGEMAQCKRACLASRRPEFSSQHFHKKAGYGYVPQYYGRPVPEDSRSLITVTLAVLITLLLL